MTDSVTPGNRAPREFFGRRPPLGSIEERALLLLDHIWVIGPTTWVDIRRKVIGGDRGPLYSIRAALLAAGLMYSDRKVKGSPLYEVPSDLDTRRDLKFLSHLDIGSPVVLRSVTEPGRYQVRCGVCRLTKKTHKNSEEALAWFWGSHVREAVIHGLAST